MMSSDKQARPKNEQLIRSVPLFASLPQGELEKLAKTLTEIEVAPQSILFREGEQGRSLYIILDGEFEIIKALGTPDEKLLNVYSTGDFIGEMSLLSKDGLRTASVCSRESGRLLEMTLIEFEKLLHRHSEIGLEILRVLSIRLRRTDNETIHDLQEKNKQLAQAYEELTSAQAQLIVKQRIERELQVAQNIQLAILPRRLPKIPKFDFGARILPARAVGGDLFDFIPIGPDTLGILIGDVSDKGVPAALIMALTRSVLRVEAVQNKSPKKVLQRVNSHLLEMNDSGMFLTICYGILNLRSGEFNYARAGHTLPALFSAQGEPISIPRGQGQPLAIFSNPLFDLQTAHIPPDGCLLLYTDGVTNTMNSKGELYGLERVQGIVQRNLGITSQEICDRVVEEIQSFQENEPLQDDITVVAVKSRPSMF